MSYFPAGFHQTDPEDFNKEIKKATSEDYDKVKEFREALEDLAKAMSVAEWWDLILDGDLYRTYFGDVDEKELWERLKPVGEPVRAPVIRVSPEAPVLPPPKPEWYHELVWNTLDRLALATQFIVFLARKGCVSCPIAHTTIEIPLPTRFYLVHLGRIAVPPGCQIFSWWVKYVKFGPLNTYPTATIELYYNIPMPVTTVGNWTIQAISTIVGIMETSYKNLIEFCKTFSKIVLKKHVAPCLASAYMDLFIAPIIIKSCFKKAKEQLEKGIEQAKEIESNNFGPNVGNFLPV